MAPIQVQCTRFLYCQATALRLAREAADCDLAAVRDLEVELDIRQRWTADSEQWKAAAILVGRRRYQHRLDELEGLVVSRMFELMKMNMSQTGKFASSDFFRDLP